VAGAALQSTALGAVLALCLFAPAGDFDWPAGWAVLAFHALYAAVGARVVDPALAAERTRRHSDANARDVALAAAAFVLLLPVTLAVCGFDARWGWSTPPAPAVEVIALGWFALGYAVSLWAAATNRFFSTVARIQRERGHHVVVTGPYALVRHPGYAGALAGHLALPIALGSLWAYLPTLAGAACLVLRIGGEERMLVAELPGYRDYVAQVRWRLFPGLW
jgi:protein-S-isoprenylcysteine O-methyltransferase Ste14